MFQPQNTKNMGNKQQLPVCSFFNKPITNIVPDRIPIDLIEVYQFIKGETMKEMTLKLRSITDKKEARAFKAANFCYATFSGTFSSRNDNALIQHSGLMTLDFDHLFDIENTRNALLIDSCIETALLFTSPSGDGLKWIIEVDLSEVNHCQYFIAVSNYVKHTYGLEVDKSGKDISRACFLPHDSNIFINPKYFKQ